MDQVEAGRIITGLIVNSSRSKLYSELGWEPLYKRREKQKLILLYKIINGLTPYYMYDMIQPYTENIHDNNLRQQISGDNFRLPFCTTVSYSKSFIPCTLRLWNGLPASTKSSPSVGSCHTYSPELNHLLFYRVNSTFVSLFFCKGDPSQVHYII
jgi:hypothetical protein